ncbi:MAG: mannose-1-phosphate guanylyltransferase/mannose-6-phosphate isomerase [Robiginitomaculum sp.]
MAKIYPVIMSGGAGTRLWPLSRKQSPKQYHAMISQNTMFAQTLLRMRECADNDTADPIIICADGHQALVKAQSEALDIALIAIILEPCARNTAAVGAIAAAFVKNIDPDGIILLLPADHHIEDNRAFWAAIEKGIVPASKGYLVTLGINPTEPETGFGYIQCGDQLGIDTYKINSFKEKPDAETAQSYLDAGEYFWNAGIFMFNATRAFSEYQTHASDILEQSVMALNAALLTDNCVLLDEVLFANCRSDSIDYAIMEKTQFAAIVAPVEAGWNDIGSWRAISEFLQKHDTSAESIGIGDVKMFDVKNSLIRSDGPFVAAIGVQDLVVIAMADVVLVAHKDNTQDIKKITEFLKSKDRVELL